MKYDVAIIGAGVIGCAIARELARYNLTILLIEKGNDVSLGSTKANSGIIHGGYDARYGTLKAQFSRAGNNYYTQWDQELQFGIRRIGSLVCAFNTTEYKILSSLMENGEKNGVHDLLLLSSSEVKEREPNINPDVCGALYCPSTGIVSPYEVCIALAENAVLNGVDCKLSHEIHAIHPQSHDNSVTLISNQQEFHARCVINAAGVHADTIASMIHTSPPFSIHPRKGHYYVCQRGYMPIHHVLFPVPTEQGKGVLVSPTYHGNLIIGPDSQTIDDKHNTTPSPSRLEYIADTAKNMIPTLDSSKAIRSYAGLRASAHTKDFIITSDTQYPHFIHVAGIDSPGLTAAPAISQHVITQHIIPQLHAQHGLSIVPRSDFIAERTTLIPCQQNRSFLPMKEIHTQANLSEDNPKRIICRCEQVTQQTIVEALARSPHPLSVDAIKRRTRASMGICQGTFCRPRIKALISQIYTIPLDEVPES